MIAECILDQIKKDYPVGSRVELDHMNDKYATYMVPGIKGTVSHIDALGTVFVDWDNGSDLGVVLSEDRIHRI